VVTVKAGTVALPNIPSGSTATEVLVWNGGNVQRRSAEGLAWLLTGNSGTDPAVNFLGTTDAQPLVIRTNNTRAGAYYGDGGGGHWDGRGMAADGQQ
jgi:trimeric autotransporter adhesin